MRIATACARFSRAFGMLRHAENIAWPMRPFHGLSRSATIKLTRYPFLSVGNNTVVVRRRREARSTELRRPQSRFRDPADGYADRPYLFLPGPEATVAAGGVRCLLCPLSSTASTAETFSTRSGVKLVVDRAEERAGPEDVGDQALMRGLVTAFPFVRPGLSP